MLTLVIFLVVLALLVLVHEFGHFVTARKAGMRVEEFGFGFPPKIWCKKIKDTVYSINWLPLGGFVKIKGEDGDAANEPDSFGFQKAWKRVIVLVAGVVMNFLLACVLLSIGFMIGLPADFSTGTDSKAIVVSPPAVMVQYVEKGSPAEKIGIKFGDEIILINNEAMKSSQQMVGFVQTHGEEELTITVKRKDGEQTLKATPQVLKVGDTTPRLGVMLADAGIIRYPWYISLYKGFIAAGIGLINIFIAFYILLKNLIIGKGLAFDVSGPVGIAVMVGQSARMGISYLINVTAMISLSLTAINILPIPALDGGRILFILIEKIIRRPVNRKYEQYAHMVGFALLMLLILVVTGRDILGLIK